MKLVAVVSLFAILFPRISAAQGPVPYSENFDSAPSGWTFANSSALVGWAVDGDPLIMKVGNGSGGAGADGPTAGGSAGSLNYNDGINYEEDVTLAANKGTATSPVISIAGMAGPIEVIFDTNHETEYYLNGDPTFDIMQVDILDSTATTLFASFTLGDDSVVPGSFTTDAGIMGTFHKVVLDLGTVGGGTLPALTSSIVIRFVFSTVDDIDNNFSGWFVDNLQVCDDSIPPSTPVNVAPPDMTIIVAGPATTIPLDWTDSTDTTSCGTGTIQFYIVLVQNLSTLAFDYVNLVVPSMDTIPAGTLAAGDYQWEVFAIDAAGNGGLFSAFTQFTIEPPLPPLAPDSLFVNNSSDGAQAGNSGFVDPVVDETPNFSAVYRDGNTTDTAIGYSFQVSEDFTFAVVDFDSLPQVLSPALPKDTRIGDLTINVNLRHDTIYFWRIQFTDANGVTGPFSVAQSFRTGDDFDFGIRHGSTHHGRKCYVATAAWGGVTPEVGNLMAFRATVLEHSPAGRLFSSWYLTAGADLASRFERDAASRLATRSILTLFAARSLSPSFVGLACLALVTGLVLAAVRRS